MVIEILIFLALKVRAFRWGEEKKKKREGKEKKKKIQVWNSCLELWFGTLVFISMEPIYMVLLVRKPS